MRSGYALLLILILGTLLPALAQQPAIHFCADDAQWPPFSYSDSQGAMNGFTIDLIEQIFADQAKVTQLPWRRCLVATEQGKQMQVAIDASTSKEREQKFLLTKAYYQLTPYFFYSIKQHPHGVSIQQGQQLAQFGQVCGLRGYNYSNFALGQTPVYTGADNFQTLLEMLKRGRCGLFIGRYEIIAGLAKLDIHLLDDAELRYAPIPDAQPEPFYMLISRNIPTAQQLKQQIDEGIERMTENGMLEQLKQRHQELSAPR